MEHSRTPLAGLGIAESAFWHGDGPSRPWGHMQMAAQGSLGDPLGTGEDQVDPFCQNCAVSFNNPVTRLVRLFDRET